MDNPINICYLSPKFKFIGGAEISLDRLIRSLPKKKINSTVMTMCINNNSDLVPGKDKINKKILCVSSPEAVLFSHTNGKRWYEIATRTLVDKLEIAGNPDIIYLNTLGLLAHPDLYEKLFGYEKPIIAKATVANQFDLIKHAKKFLLSEKYAKFLSIHCISREIEKRALKFGFKKSHLFYCPNLIDMRNFSRKRNISNPDLKKQLGPSNELVFVYIGRFAAQKNIDKIVKIFKKLEKRRKKIKLLMIGYESHPEIRPLIKKLKKASENIIWVGKVDNRKIQGYLKAADCFIMASQDEGMSNALMEAMATGLCPIVPKNISGMKDLIKDDVSGILYDSNDLDSLVGRLEKMNREKAENIGMEARKRVGILCDADRIASIHANFYKEKVKKFPTK